MWQDREKGGYPEGMEKDRAIMAAPDLVLLQEDLFFLCYPGCTYLFSLLLKISKQKKRIFYNILW